MSAFESHDASADLLFGQMSCSSDVHRARFRVKGLGFRLMSASETSFYNSQDTHVRTSIKAGLYRS